MDIAYVNISITDHQDRKNKIDLFLGPVAKEVFCPYVASRSTVSFLEAKTMRPAHVLVAR